MSIVSVFLLSSTLHFRTLDAVKYYWSSVTPSYVCYLGDGHAEYGDRNGVSITPASVVVPPLTHQQRRFTEFQKYATPILGAVPHRNLTYAHALYVYTIDEVMAFRASTYTTTTVYRHKYGCNEEGDVYPNAVRLVDCAIQLADRWTDNYSHMMNEGLTRLLLVDAHVLASCHVIVPRHPYDGHHNRRLLHAMFGIPESRVLESDPPVYARRMYIPEAWECCAPNPMLMHILSNVAHATVAVRDQVYANATHAKMPLWRVWSVHDDAAVYVPRTIVYLSRSRSKSQNERNIVNEGAILQLLADAAALHQLKFVIHDPAEGTLDKTKDAMQSARIIVGMHGAALANMIFAPRGTTAVIEFAAKYITMHANQAFALDLRYYAIETRPDPQNSMDDFYVDVDEIKRVLQQEL